MLIIYIRYQYVIHLHFDNVTLLNIITHCRVWNGANLTGLIPY